MGRGEPIQICATEISLEITPAMIEASARCRCKREGGDPDFEIHYQCGATLKMARDPIPDYLIGTKRHDGSVIEQWPTMPLWEWKFAHGVEQDLKAALAAAH